jgi:serine/threonine protein kinase
MGVVYLARDESLDRDVALKFLAAGAASDAVSKSRFTREAKAGTPGTSSNSDSGTLKGIGTLADTVSGQGPAGRDTSLTGTATIPLENSPDWSGRTTVTWNLSR